MPTVFAFSKKPIYSRPTPLQRSKDAQVRQDERKRKLDLAKLPRYGPLQEVDSLKDLADSRDREVSVAAQVSSLKEEVRLLKKQLFRFENLKEDSKFFQFNTGLTVRAWDALWAII